MQAASKHQLREELAAARAQRSAEQVARARAGVRAAVLARCAQQRWACVAGYVPLRTEPGSVELLAGLTELGVRVLVPVLLPDRDLDWGVWRAPGQPAAPPLGVGAIAAADAVLVPALAVATDGVRLGRGGGSYDRALTRVGAGTPVAALLYDDELREQLPREPWDLPVSAVVTPSGWRDLAEG